MSAPTAAVLVIGDEILSGKFADENAAHLIRELRDLGVALRRIEVVPDVLADIADSVRALSSRYDHVFTSGGVGPTHDDVTIEAIAGAFGVRVVRHPILEELLRTHYGSRLEERNLRMAEVPEGAVMVPADSPSWPVTSFRNIYILPGVPSIFRRKFNAIRERFRVAPFFVRRVYCMADEGVLAAFLDAIVADFPGVSVGSYPRYDATDFRVLITLEGKDEGHVAAAALALVERLPANIVVRAD